MGDRLRNAIAIAGDWNDEEIREYERGRIKKLGGVYMTKGITTDNPAERARYLDSKLRIADNSPTEETILIKAKVQGKPAALITLEKIASSLFF